MNIEHLYEGVRRTSRVLQWVAVPVPVRQSIVAGNGEGVGLGFALAAVVALRDAARDRLVPSVVVADGTVEIIDD